MNNKNNYHQRKRNVKKTKHHVPPTNPDKEIKPRIIKKQQRHHEAYHLLFGAAPSLNSCIIILARDWWPYDIPPV